MKVCVVLVDRCQPSVVTTMANFASQYVGTDKNNAVVDGWPEPGEAYPLPRGHKALYEVLEGAPISAAASPRIGCLTHQEKMQGVNRTSQDHRR